MPGGIDLTPLVLLGTVGAAVTVGVTYLIAGHWKRRNAPSYCISALVFYSVLYIAAFEYGILDAIRTGKSVPDDMIGILVLGHGAVTAVGVAIFTLLLFGLFAGLRPRLEKSPDPVQAYAGCAAFCLVIAVFLNPVGGVEHLQGLQPGSAGAANWARTVFPTPGLVRRVQVKDGTLTHYIAESDLNRAGANLETYVRMALAHRLYFDNDTPGAVVIREANTGRLVATRHPDGRFRRQIARKTPRN